MDPDVHVRLLGGFELRHGGMAVNAPMSAQRLVAFLALNRRRVPRSQLAGILWPDTTQARAAASLRTALWRLSPPREALVEVTPSHVALRPAVRVDVTELERTCQALRQDPVAPELLRTDPSTFALELLPEVWDSWLVPERERVRQLSLQALELLVERQLDQGDARSAVLAALAAVSLDPLGERANRLLARSFLASGNRTDAARHLARYQAALVDDLASGLIDDLAW